MHCTVDSILLSALKSRELGEDNTVNSALSLHIYLISNIICFHISFSFHFIKLQTMSKAKSEKQGPLFVMAVLIRHHKKPTRQINLGSAVGRPCVCWAVFSSFFMFF